MTRHRWAQIVDGIATADPERCGYGYADTQHPWHHDAAIELGRSAAIDLLAETEAIAGKHGTVVLVGLGMRPGLHLALRATGARVVTVDGDPDRLAALREAPGTDAFDVQLFHGDPGDLEVAAAVGRAVGQCDVVVLAAAGSYEDVRRQWIGFAPLVRDGGLVAIVDRSQAFALERRPFDVDRFVVDLDRDVLAPAGVRARRFGGALAVHLYVQTEATRTAPPPAWPRGFRAACSAEPLATVGGLALFPWQERTVAIEAGAGAFDARWLEQNRYVDVLAATDRSAVERCAAVWQDSSDRLATARQQLRANDVRGATATVAQLAEERPWLGAVLTESLAVAPWNRATLLALGTLRLLTDAPRQGVALLRRALGMELADGELMQTVAAAYLQVLRDHDGARTLLRDGKQRVRTHKVARTCMQDLRGNVLWHYPQLLVAVQSVVHVGAGAGELVAAWTALEIPDQVHVEGEPAAFAELERRCATASYGRPRAVRAVLGATVGNATLHRVPGSVRGSLLRPRAENVVTSTGAVTTLDALLAAGTLDARRCDLLFVDAEGAELDVLRGGVELLRHVDVVCVTIWREPRFHDTPMPLDIQRFLRELNDGDGFALRAFEPDADPARGTAVFRRLRAREVRR